MNIIDKLLIKFHIKKPPENHDADGEKNKLPPPIAERLKAENLNTDNLIFFFKSDMNSEALYSDTLLMFDEKGVYVADFKEEIKPKKKSKKKIEIKPELLNLTAIPIEEIDEICIEQCIATGRLTYKYKGEYFALGCFSIGLLSQAECFQKVFNNFKNNKDYQMYIDSMKKSVCKKCGKPVPPGRVFCKKCTGKSSTIKRLFSFFKEVRGKMIFFIVLLMYICLLYFFLNHHNLSRNHQQSHRISVTKHFIACLISLQ
jgi:hypothetical protein